MTDLSPEKRGLKSMLRLLVQAVGGTDAATMILGLKAAAPVSMAMSFEAERFLTWEQVMRLEAAAPEPLVSDWMRRRHAGEQAGSKRRVGLNDLALCWKEGGDFKTMLAEALADGVIDPVEAQALVKEAGDVIALYTELRRALMRQA